MHKRAILAVAALALAACGQPGDGGGSGAGDPQLEAPATDAEPARTFAPGNDAARSTTGDLVYTLAFRLPDATQTSGDAQEILTLRGANGLVVEAQIAGAVSPATEVGGRTLRALMALGVEEPQVLVYRVNAETRSASGQGLCGADAASHVVVWEPTMPSQSVLKVMGVRGGAPGAGGAQACSLLDYRE
jgi:hypothetical protein